MTEDFPLGIIAKRKQLQSELYEVRNNGKYAIIRYDKLIVKEFNKGNRSQIDR